MITATIFGVTTATRSFEPFFTTKNVGATRGTGPGLSLVYTIAKQDGWGAAVRTAPDHGTTFRLRLPQAQARSVNEPPSPASPTDENP